MDETTAPPLKPLPALYIADDKQDLGAFWENPDAMLSVPISNRSYKDVEIAGFKRDCDCGEVVPPRLTVPALLGTANVTMKVGIVRKSHQARDLDRRYCKFTLVPLRADKTAMPPLEHFHLLYGE